MEGEGSDATFEFVPGNTRTRAIRWTEPRCLECGETADHALRELVPHCETCGCDFHARPPRSYAELEGLTPLDIGAAAERRRGRSRWTASGVLFVVAVVAFVALTAALDAGLFDR